MIAPVPAKHTTQNASSLPATWSKTEFMSDPVAAMLLDNTNCVQDAFFYSHHTFSHQNLDNATLYDVDTQIELNIQMAVRSLASNGLPTA